MCLKTIISTPHIKVACHNLSGVKRVDMYNLLRITYKICHTQMGPWLSSSLLIEFLLECLKYSLKLHSQSETSPNRFGYYLSGSYVNWKWFRYSKARKNRLTKAPKFNQSRIDVSITYHYEYRKMASCANHRNSWKVISHVGVKCASLTARPAL